MKIKCVITDDEPIAVEILEDYINLIPELELVAKCHNALEAFSAIQKFGPDLLLMDIQMPEITGLDFLKSLKNSPHVIITTAYPQYALEGYNLDVIDYLLKPISFDRFLKAINKVVERVQLSNPNELPVKEEQVNSKDEKSYAFLKANHELVKVKFEDIYFVEGLKDYVKVICEGKKIVTLATMKSMEEMLNNGRFYRIHRSYIINLDKVDAVVGNNFRIKGELVPIGKSYRKEVHELIEKGI